MKIRTKYRNPDIGFKEIMGALKIIKIMKNWPVYFKDFFGLYSDCFLTFNLKNGINLFIKSNSFERNIFNEIFVYNEYTPSGFEIKNNDTIIDIGANCGIFSVYAASKAKNGNVYAFEPVRENFQRLLNNIKLNNLSNIIPFNLAVSNKKEKRTINLSKINSGGHSFYLKDKNEKFITQQVNTISLKEIFKQNKIDKVDFLKCDCEGAEYEILFSFPELLRKIDKISMEVHYIDEKRNIQTMTKFLKENGFIVKVTPDITTQNKLNFLYAKRNEKA